MTLFMSLATLQLEAEQLLKGPVQLKFMSDNSLNKRRDRGPVNRFKAVLALKAF
jgi:hypothetical protein